VILFSVGVSAAAHCATMLVPIKPPKSDAVNTGNITRILVLRDAPMPDCSPVTLLAVESRKHLSPDYRLFFCVLWQTGNNRRIQEIGLRALAIFVAKSGIDAATCRFAAGFTTTTMSVIHSLRRMVALRADTLLPIGTIASAAGIPRHKPNRQLAPEHGRVNNLLCSRSMSSLKDCQRRTTTSPSRHPTAYCRHSGHWCPSP
jgi:hypothetical protein